MFIPFEKREIEQSIPSRFEKQVERYPQRLAVKERQSQLTYQSLNQAANRLARIILDRRPPVVEPSAILLEPGIDLAIAILGVLKANKFYVPIDAALPWRRQQTILEDTQASLIITNTRNFALAQALAVRQCKVINLEEIDASISSENLNFSPSPDNLAYILYTSGSTGKPKGIMQKHRNVLHNVFKYTNSVRICPGDRLSLLSSFSVGASISAIFGALLNGASLFPFNLRELGLTSLIEWLEAEEITIYHSVPTVFRSWVQLLRYQTFPHLRLLKLGGEPLARRDVELYQKHFSENCLLYVGLGSTEMNIICNYLIDKKTKLLGNIVPVGYAVEDTEILLINEEGKLVNEGEIGEIFIKSPYLFCGYWQAPELTQAVLQSDSQEPLQWRYQTGDLGRFRADSCLEHLGRKDFQVKISGYRIEVTEIEMALLDSGLVKEAAVWVDGNQTQKYLAGDEDFIREPRLIAYLVCQGIGNSQNSRRRQLLSFLKEKLPDYMVPSAFIFLDAIPLTPNGKIDRRALPIPDLNKQHSGATFVPPRNELERQLVKIWEEVLGIKPVGIQDNFFDLGGHSLLAARLVAQIEQTGQTKLPLTSLFQSPTVAELAPIIQQDRELAPNSSLIAIQPRGSKPPLFAIHVLGTGMEFYRPLAWHLGLEQPLYGLNAQLRKGQDGPANQVESLAAHYIEEMRTLQSDGPYFLVGFSFGGIVAFEMAQQLVSQGQKIALLALLDTYASGALKPLSKREKIATYWRNIQQEGIAYLVNKTRENIRGNMIGMNLYITKKFKEIQRQFYLSQGLQELPEDLQSFIFNQENLQAKKCYVPQTYPGRLTLIRARERQVGVSVNCDPYLGWGKLAVGGVEIYDVPGTHLTMLQEPNVELLADKLKVYLP